MGNVSSIYGTQVALGKAMGKGIFLVPKLRSRPVRVRQKTILSCRILSETELEVRKKQRLAQKRLKKPKALSLEMGPSKKEYQKTTWTKKKRKKPGRKPQKSNLAYQTVPRLALIVPAVPRVEPFRTKLAKTIAGLFLNKSIKIASKKTTKAIGKVIKVDDSFVTIRLVSNNRSLLESIEDFQKKYEVILEE